MFSELIGNILSKREEYSKDLKALEENLLDFLKTDNQFSILRPFVINKGKRIRSILYFLNWKSNALINKHKTIALIEMIHFASILHDDVVDENISRRSGFSFVKEYGKKKSILFGDFLLVKAIDELLRIHSQNEIVKNFCLRECSATAYGAVIEHLLNEKSSFQECLRVASLKTGSLFKLSCFLGRYLSTEDFETSKKTAICGLCFGTLFQFQNDIDSYKFESFKDSEDYMQKNITLPLIILRDNFKFDISKFHNSNQENYDEIRKLILSSEFSDVSKKLLSKLIDVCTELV